MELCLILHDVHYDFGDLLRQFFENGVAIPANCGLTVAHFKPKWVQVLAIMYADRLERLKHVYSLASEGLYVRHS